MSRLADIFATITSLDEPIVDRAMAAGLATADDQAVRLIVDALLERGDPRALVDVVTRYDRLPPDLQQRVAEHDAALYRPLREAARRRDPQVRLNVVRIVEAAQSARLAYLVAEQLRHGPSNVHDEAAQCLLTFTKLAATRDAHGSAAQKPPFDAAATGYLLAAVEDATLAYGQHSQQAVLESLCELAPRTLPKVMTHLGLSDSKALGDFRDLLESGRQPSIRRSLLSFLSVPTLFGAVIAGLRRAAGEGQIEVVFSSTYLLASPRHARALARVADPESFMLTPERIARLEPEHARGLVRWVTTLPLAPKDRVIQLAAMHRLRDPAARLCALRALIETSTRFGIPGADAVISGYCFDPDVHAARLALRHLIHKQWTELPRLLLKLINSPHQDIRTLAADRIAPIGFDRLWQAWPTLPYAQQLETGKALLKIDTRFERKLAKHLAQQVDADRLRALT